MYKPKGRALLCAATLCGLLLSLFAVAPANAAPVHATAHANSACGGISTVYTPPAGHAMTAAMLGMPKAAQPLLATAAAHHVRWASQLDCTARPNHIHRLQPGPRVNDATAPNWSGYQVNTNAPNYVQGEWTEPDVSFPANGLSAFSSIWTGIGGGIGAGSGELLQDGTEEDQVCTDVAGECSYSYIYDFWVEDFPKEAEQVVSNITPVPGDAVAGAVFWSASTGTEFTLCDFTQQWCGTGSEADNAPGNTAEWVVERPTLALTGLPPLADVGTVTFTNAGFDEDQQGNIVDTIADGGPTPIDMVDGSTFLAAPGPLDTTGTSFDDFWDAYE